MVEDERAVSRLLEQALRESGYEVTVAQNGREGLAMAQDKDLLVVDVLMPEMDGFAMVRILRERGNRSPVLFLSAKDSMESRVHGLDLGGDDYLVKPYKLAELLARIRALLRRASDAQDVITVGDLWMDVRKRKVRRGDRWIYLSNTEFAMLHLFMVRAGEPLRKQTILREVWNETDLRDENLVEVYVSYLRNKLEHSGEGRLLHTIRGKGYVMKAVDEP